MESSHPYKTNKSNQQNNYNKGYTFFQRNYKYKTIQIHLITQINYLKNKKNLCLSTKVLSGGEDGIWTHAPVSRPTPLAGEPLHHLGTSPWWKNKSFMWRRGRDSNSWSLARSLVFKTSSLNHSDTSPFGTRSILS